MLDYQPQKNLLQGKTIVITGASDGIGKAAAHCFADYGAKLILLGRSAAKLAALSHEISQAGHHEPMCFALDFANGEDADYQRLAEEIASQYQQLDGLLHSASLLGERGPFAKQTSANLRLLLQVNVIAEMALTQALLPLLAKADNASIVFTSSSVGRQGRATWGAYAISKFATEGMMQVLADECAGSDIRVNSLNPGATRTQMRAAAYPEEDPLTLTTPTQIMPLYLYLMGDDSRHENGQAFSAQPKTITSATASRPSCRKSQ